MFSVNPLRHDRSPVIHLDIYFENNFDSKYFTITNFKKSHVAVISDLKLGIKFGQIGLKYNSWLKRLKCSSLVKNDNRIFTIILVLTCKIQYMNLTCPFGASLNRYHAFLN